MITRAETLDTLLLPYQSLLGIDFDGYRNHLYRIVNFCHLLMPLDQDSASKVEIAAVFHDLAIWTNQTADYLAPSEQLAHQYLQDIDLLEWRDDICQMIRDHHKITHSKASNTLVETFRKADWIDVTLGARRFGLSRKSIKQVQTRFPDQGFHPLLANLVRRQLLQHPLNPLPMLKW